MTPRQRADMERIQARNKFLEQFNREQQALLRRLQRDRSMPPKGGLNLLRWLAERESGAANVSKSDIRSARSLLAWLDRRAQPQPEKP